MFHAPLILLNIMFHAPMGRFQLELFIFITNFPTVIPFKHTAFHSMANRRLNVPLNQTDYNTEVNTIKYIAQENG